jgi:hypothetical protein|tara:strand:- start:1989 stop:2720 length:732 start_codon:yes stop_codon:yes gene_type:complete
MTSKFEKLIEHVINDEENEAQALFHEIVVETSREIYENLMDEEDSDEEETVEEGMMNDGDAADDLITDVETEEEGMSEDEELDVEMDDAEDFGAEVGAEEGEEEDIEDRVVDLEDKLDELMAEFEAMMGGEEEAEDEMDMDMDMDMGDEEMMPEMGMMENVDLKAAPKPVTTEPAGTNSRSTVAANSGAKGMAARPVRTTDGATAGRANPSVKDMGMTTSPAQGAAPKPVSTQAAGVNTKSPV